MGGGGRMAYRKSCLGRLWFWNGGVKRRILLDRDYA